MSFRSVSRTHAGSVRPCNEDSVLDAGESGIWAVSDGMGGHAAGDVASALVVETLKGLTSNGAPRDLMKNVRQALAHANHELYRQGASHSSVRTMGATVVVLGVEGDKFFCVWAGDSRLYRFRGGKLTQLTRDHRYVQALIDAGMLNEKEAETHPRRSVITRAVGVEATVELDSCEGEVQPGDIFLLATDGVTGVCTNAELAGILSGRDLETAADMIVDLCLAHGAPDNLSLVLVRPS